VRSRTSPPLLLAALLLAGCADDPCVSQCELAAGSCDETRAPSDYPDRDSTAAAWTAAVVSCDQPLPYVVAGDCSGGGTFLLRGGGFTSEARVFDPTGSFVALSTQTDVIDPTCDGRGYWPQPPACDGATVSEVLCGTLFEVGQAVALP
jgi:hypothetical protein